MLHKSATNTKKSSVKRQTGERLPGDHGIGCESDYHRESRNEKTENGQHPRKTKIET